MLLSRSLNIKRKGISADDEALKEGQVHIIRNNQPQYVMQRELEIRRKIQEAL